MQAPTLFFEEPDADEVRVQLFAIMLGDQILCSTAAQKGSKPRKKTTETGTTQRRPESPSCMDRAKRDTMLRFALWPDWLQQNGAECMKEIVDYAMKTSPKMEEYMKDSYKVLLETDDHLLMMAAIFFYIYWLCDYDSQTRQVLSRKQPPQNSFLHSKFVLDPKTVANLCDACYAFERGRDQMTSFPSFVHTFVTNHFKRVL